MSEYDGEGGMANLQFKLDHGLPLDAIEEAWLLKNNQNKRRIDGGRRSWQGLKLFPHSFKDKLKD